MQQPLKTFALSSLVILLVGSSCAIALGAESSRNPASREPFEPAAYQQSASTMQLVPTTLAQNQQGPNVQGPNVPPPNVPVPNPSPNPVPPPIPGMQPIGTQQQTGTPQTIVVPVNPAGPAVNAPTVIVPPQNPPTVVVPPPAPGATAPAPPTTDNNSPLLDGKLPAEELLPPVVQEGACEEGHGKGVQPYGGGHPTDWPWGCGGSPYRNGPGLCDNWKVGCRWHVTVDGLVMRREPTLDGLVNGMPTDFPTNVTSGIVGDPKFAQFDHGPGGRITFTSQVACCKGFDIQAAYEGIDDWNASIVYPIQPLAVVPNVGVPPVPFAFVIPPSPNTEPPAPFPEGFLQRTLQYRSSLNSGELNFVRGCDTPCRPYCGVRFIRFDDEINDSINQEAQIPLPGPRTDFIGTGGATAVNDPIGPTSETDHFSIFHQENNLMGFQIGFLHDTIQLNNRFAIEGFVNAGVYYNRIKYSNVRGVFTTQTFADNTRSTAFDDARTDNSNAVINDSRELSDISYAAEASLTGVCRLNKCWALRAGYQALWINHLHMADAAFLGDPGQSGDLLFHGWHAGIECRR